MMLVEIEVKWNDLQEAYQQVLLSEKSIESSTENLRLNNDYYKAGTVSLSDLLDAQSLMQQSHDQYAEACTAYQQKLTAYLQATGRELVSLDSCKTVRPIMNLYRSDFVYCM